MTHRNSTRNLSVLIAIILMVTAGMSQAATVTWDGSAGTAWDVADNWDTAAVPVAADDVVINLNNKTVNHTAAGLTSTVSSIEIGSSGSSGMNLQIGNDSNNDGFFETLTISDDFGGTGNLVLGGGGGSGTTDIIIRRESTLIVEGNITSGSVADHEIKINDLEASLVLHGDIDSAGTNVIDLLLMQSTMTLAGTAQSLNVADFQLANSGANVPALVMTLDGDTLVATGTGIIGQNTKAGANRNIRGTLNIIGDGSATFNTLILGRTTKDDPHAAQQAHGTINVGTGAGGAGTLTINGLLTIGVEFFATTAATGDITIDHADSLVTIHDDIQTGTAGGDSTITLTSGTLRLTSKDASDLRTLGTFTFSGGTFNIMGFNGVAALDTTDTTLAAGGGGSVIEVTTPPAQSGSSDVIGATWVGTTGTWDATAANWDPAILPSDAFGVTASGETIPILTSTNAITNWGNAALDGASAAGGWTLAQTANDISLYRSGAGFGLGPGAATIQTSDSIVSRTSDLSIQFKEGLSADATKLVISDGELNLTGAGIDLILGGTGANGNVDQTGGTVDIDDGILQFGVGNAADFGGVYSLTGGTLDVGGVDGSNYSIVKSNAGMTGSENVYVDGGLLIVAGDINVHNFRVGNAAGTTGEHTLVAGKKIVVDNAVRIGNNGMGTYTQTGGSLTTGGNLELGDQLTGVGTVNISGGNIDVSAVVKVGDAGTGVFIQTGGTVTQAAGNNFILGEDATTSYGEYTISGGELHVGAQLQIGVNGVGVFNLTGGTVYALGGSSPIVGHDGGTGTMNISGSGVLISTSTINVGRKGSGVWLQSGGSVSTTGFALATSSGGTGNGIVDLSGGTLDVTGNVTIGQHSSGVGADMTVRDTGVLLVGGDLYVGEDDDGTLTVSGGVVTVGDGSGGDHLIIGENKTGLLTQTGGVITAVNDLRLGINTGGSGTLDLSGGTMNVSQNVAVGQNNGAVNGLINVSGTGVLNANGGELSVAEDTDGAVVQTGGVVNVAGNLLIGDGGADDEGSYAISAGTLNVTGELTVGNNADSPGTLTISGTGVVNAFWVQVGQASGSQGTVDISAGALNLDDALDVGNGAGSSGELTLSGTGAVTGEEVVVGYAGTGLLTQTGGDLTVDYFDVGEMAGAVGSVEMSGGFLTTDVLEWVGVNGVGVFTQTEGTNTTTVLAVGASGLYDYQGGTLIITGGMSVFSGGTLNLEGPVLDLDFSSADSIVDISGDILNGGNDSLTQGDGLLIVGSLIGIGDEFGTFSSTAITHLSGEDLVLDEDEGFGGIGVINDHVITDGGNILANAGGFIELNGGLTQVGGTVDLGDGALIVNDLTSGISGGGTLSASEIIIGSGGGATGVFNHEDGVVNVTGSDTLELGVAADDSGTYLLSTGTLNVVDNAVIGVSGTGHFVHSGGTANIDNLVLAQNGTAIGVYVLSGGVLNVDNGTQGAGAGDFHLDGGDLNLTTGTWNTNNVFIGENLGTSGDLTLSSGDLVSTLYLFVGRNATGSVTQSGGEISAGRVRIGDAEGSTGSYTITGGVLDSRGTPGNNNQTRLRVVRSTPATS